MSASTSRSCRYQDQTRFFDKEKGTRGNCLQAVLATVLGLPIDAVPDLTFAHESAWMDCMKAFVEFGGYEWHFGAPDEVPPGTLYIVNGMSPRGVRHGTVWKDGVMVHDPHPSRAGLTAKDGNVWWFLPSKRSDGRLLAACTRLVRAMKVTPIASENPFGLAAIGEVMAEIEGFVNATHECEFVNTLDDRGQVCSICETEKRP